MANQAWPHGLTNQFYAGAQGRPLRRVARVKTDAGVVRQRRRLAGAPRHETFRGELYLTREELALFWAFFWETTREGVDAFTGFQHPRTRATNVLLGFANEPQERFQSGRFTRVALELETRA